MRRMLLLVSMHLLVLSAFRLGSWFWGGSVVGESQCTFWCSVLSDPFATPLNDQTLYCLNAPSDAQCFPTRRRV